MSADKNVVRDLLSRHQPIRYEVLGFGCTCREWPSGGVDFADWIAHFLAVRPERQVEELAVNLPTSIHPHGEGEPCTTRCITLPKPRVVATVTIRTPHGGSREYRLLEDDRMTVDAPDPGAEGITVLIEHPEATS